MIKTSHHTPGSTTSFHQILIIIFGTLFFGGSGDESLAERVEEAVSAGDRRAEAVAAAKAVDGALREDVDAVINWHEDFFRTIGQPEVTEAMILGKIDEIIETLEQLERAQVRLRADLHSKLERSEWDKVFD